MRREGRERRRFIKRSAMGACGLALGAVTVRDLARSGAVSPKPGRGFFQDAPDELWQWAREAAWYDSDRGMVRCRLCPHECVLAEGDRGFCRTRVVLDDKLHTLVYGNPCSVHVDPVEKKPLFHFLPGSPILSLATAGCNLRCLNCQNWEISQAKPEATRNGDLPPASLVDYSRGKGIPSLAYTYSEPIIFYEYVRDTASLARQAGIRNVLVTAGYILEPPLRELCRVVDAANVDLKGFNDEFYRKVTGGRLRHVLRSLEVMREEGVWVEVTRLIVPTYSDDLEDIRQMCAWMARALGPDTPLHLSRFHPAYRLQGLPPTPVETLERAGQIAAEEGLHYVYVGNVPGHGGQDTICPHCHEPVIERRGYTIVANRLEGTRCPCGREIPGVWL